MKKQKLYKQFSILSAILLWGSWAYYINHGSEISRISSAICQAAISGLATSLMISALNALYKQTQSIILSSLIVSSTTTLSAIAIHYLTGTSEIIATISPAATVALIFSLFTSYNLKRNLVRESIACLKN